MKVCVREIIAYFPQPQQENHIRDTLLNGQHSWIQQYGSCQDPLSFDTLQDIRCRPENKTCVLWEVCAVSWLLPVLRRVERLCSTRGYTALILR